MLKPIIILLLAAVFTFAQSINESMETSENSSESTAIEASNETAAAETSDESKTTETNETSAIDATAEVNTIEADEAAATEATAEANTIEADEAATTEATAETNTIETDISNTTDYDSMLSEGKSKKGAGVALITTGALFMAGSITYTVLFVIDKEQFGIPLGSTSSGSYRYDYYLNPGIFGVAVAAPCLATGIVNLIKGKIQIGKAKKLSSVDVTPYFVYSSNSKTTATGVSVQF